MELLIVKLCSNYPSPVRKGGKRVDLWNLVAAAYRNIRELVINNPIVTGGCRITLFGINNATLQQWFNKRTRDQERKMLEQNIRLCEPSMSTDRPLPAPRTIPDGSVLPVPPDQQHEFVLPPFTVGSSQRMRKRQLPPVESPANPKSSYSRVPVLILPGPSSVSTDLPPILRSASPMRQDVARSTLWYWRQKEKKKAAGELVPTNTIQRQARTYTCHKCGQLRTRETHQQQYNGQWYCPKTDTETFDECRSSREKCRKEKKQQKQQQN